MQTDSYSGQRLVLVFALLSCIVGFYADIVSAGNGFGRGRIDFFWSYIDPLELKHGNTTFRLGNTRIEITDELGKPNSMTVKSGTSPHRGQSRDTIYTLVYEGLEINMYHSFINDREMKYSVTISGEHYEMISGIKVGTAKGYIVGILGVPSRISATVLIYVCTGCDSGGEETLRFFLKDDVVEKIEIHYSID